MERAFVATFEPSQHLFTKHEEEDSTLDPQSLMAAKVPNRHGFINDPHPDMKDKACMRSCQPLCATPAQAKKWNPS